MRNAGKENMAARGPADGTLFDELLGEGPPVAGVARAPAARAPMDLFAPSKPALALGSRYSPSFLGAPNAASSHKRTTCARE